MLDGVPVTLQRREWEKFFVDGLLMIYLLLAIMQPLHLRKACVPHKGRQRTRVTCSLFGATTYHLGHAANQAQCKWRPTSCSRILAVWHQQGRTGQKAHPEHPGERPCARAGRWWPEALLCPPGKEGEGCSVVQSISCCFSASKASWTSWLSFSSLGNPMELFGKASAKRLIQVFACVSI